MPHNLRQEMIILFSDSFVVNYFWNAPILILTGRSESVNSICWPSCRWWTSGFPLMFCLNHHQPLDVCAAFSTCHVLFCELDMYKLLILTDPCLGSSPTPSVASRPIPCPKNSVQTHRPTVVMGVQEVGHRNRNRGIDTGWFFSPLYFLLDLRPPPPQAYCSNQIVWINEGVSERFHSPLLNCFVYKPSYRSEAKLPLCNGKWGRQHSTNVVPHNPWRYARLRKKFSFAFVEYSVKLKSLFQTSRIIYSCCWPVISDATALSCPSGCSESLLGQWLWARAESLGPILLAAERSLLKRRGASHSLTDSTAWRAEKDIRSKFGSYYMHHDFVGANVTFLSSYCELPLDGTVSKDGVGKLPSGETEGLGKGKLGGHGHTEQGFRRHWKELVCGVSV